MNNPIFDLQDQIVTELGNMPEFIGVTGISLRKKTSAQSIATAVAQNQGLFYAVSSLKGRIAPNADQVPGPRVRLSVFVFIIETPVLNRSAQGKNVTGEELVIAALERLHCCRLPAAQQMLIFQDFDTMESPDFLPPELEGALIFGATFWTVVQLVSRANLSGVRTGPQRNQP